MENRVVFRIFPLRIKNDKVSYFFNLLQNMKFNNFTIPIILGIFK